MSLADLRREYTLAGLRRSDLLADPFQQFQKWFDEAVQAQALEPNAMTLATADKNCRPSARIVLLKGLDERGFIFFTNYESAKGRDLAENPQASLNAYWREVERQVCVCGAVTKVSREESEAYFKMRPVGSRLAAWASIQSSVIPNREFLEEKIAGLAKKFPGDDVPLPPYWGGFVLAPNVIEFWQGRPNRLHDRFCYAKKNDGSWLIERLSP